IAQVPSGETRFEARKVRWTGSESALSPLSSILHPALAARSAGLDDSRSGAWAEQRWSRHHSFRREVSRNARVLDSKFIRSTALPWRRRPYPARLRSPPTPAVRERAFLSSPSPPERGERVGVRGAALVPGISRTPKLRH